MTATPLCAIEVPLPTSERGLILHGGDPHRSPAFSTSTPPNLAGSAGISLTDLSVLVQSSR